MTKHPLDRKRTFDDATRTAQYKKIEHEQRPEGASLSARTALRRHQNEDHRADLARVKALMTET